MESLIAPYSPLLAMLPLAHGLNLIGKSGSSLSFRRMCRRGAQAQQNLSTYRSVLTTINLIVHSIKQSRILSHPGLLYICLLSPRMPFNTYLHIYLVLSDETETVCTLQGRQRMGVSPLTNNVVVWLGISYRHF